MANESKQDVIKYVKDAYDEADQAKRTRMEMNRNNYEMYHLRHDFSHKKNGQSKEILAKQAMAVEQIRSFFVQALVDVGEWWDVTFQDEKERTEALLQPHEIFKLTNYMLERADYFSHIGNAVQSALLGSLAITKVWGKQIPKPRFRTKKQGKGKNFSKKVVLEEDKTFRLCFDVVRQENYFPDPTSFNVWKVEESFVDLHKVKELAEGDEAIYDKDAVALIPAHGGGLDAVDEGKRAREVGQDVTNRTSRPTVKIWELWGNIIDKATGKMTHENIVVTIANERIVIRKPTENPFWSQKDPYVTTPLLEVANSVWHKSLMDAPTMHNRALIEIYNLLVDGGMRSVHGINQIRVDALEDTSQVSDGIPFGSNLKVNSSLPVGGKVMEPVITGDIPKDALDVMNVMQQEFNASALTNDLRQGVMPFRAVKATEVVEASNTITSVFQGIAKNVETKLILPQLEKAWMLVAQNLDKVSKEELQSLFGLDRGEEISQLNPEDVFVETVNGLKFKVFGISLTLGKQNDFRKYTTLLQTIGSSEVLIEEFAKKFDFGKLLGEIIRTVDIDADKIALEPERANLAGGPSPLDNAGATAGAPTEAPQPFGADQLAQVLGQQGFPGSPATEGQGES